MSSEIPHLAIGVRANTLLRVEGQDIAERLNAW